MKKAHDAQMAEALRVSIVDCLRESGPQEAARTIAENVVEAMRLAARKAYCRGFMRGIVASIVAGMAVWLVSTL